jgi:hypothetical protein
MLGFFRFSGKAGGDRSNSILIYDRLIHGFFSLHDRFTRGDVLTAMEKQQVEAWYAERDAAESIWLNPASAIAPDLIDLQSQVDQTLEELRTVTQQIQRVSSENQSIRQEIAELYEQ